MSAARLASLGGRHARLSCSLPSAAPALALALPLQVADFNLSRAIEASAIASTLFITNPRWLAPEVLAGNPGQLPADVWAFGTVLWELMAWKLPFDKWNAFQARHLWAPVSVFSSCWPLLLPLQLL